MYASFLKDLDVDLNTVNYYRKDNAIFYEVSLNRKIFNCPCCGSNLIYKNGNKTRKITHAASNFEKVFIILKIQKYICRNCNKNFEEKNSISQKNDQISIPTIIKILDRLKISTNTYTSVSKELFLTKQNVIEIFDKYLSIPTYELSEYISFDEKYLGSKILNDNYAFIIFDFVKKEIIDILPSRRKETLIRYFSKKPIDQRDKVKAITIDMWDTYRDIAKTYFRNAIIAVDSFHVLENMNKKMNQIRIYYMNRFNNHSDNILDNDNNYYMLKKYYYYFISEFDTLKDVIYVPKFKCKMTKHEIRKYLLDIDKELSDAYWLIQDYREFNRTATIEDCEEQLDNLIQRFTHIRFTCFLEIANMLIRWRNEIINSFHIVEYKNEQQELIRRRLSNGPIEGCNSIIKKLILVGNGYGNFKRLKKRIMYCINKTYSYKLK